MFAAALAICVVLSIVIFVNNNQVVAVTNGNNILYNNEIYAEDLAISDYDKAEYLGRVDFTAYGSSFKIYAVREMPEYILVDMGMDYRVHKRI